jgi:hypothetical protein
MPVTTDSAMAKADTVKVKTKVEAIDHTARTVTLKDRDGHLVTVQAGPEVQGFDDLKVGDKVTFRYTEGMVLQVRPAGEMGTHVTNPSGGEPSGAPYDSPSGSAPDGDESHARDRQPDRGRPLRRRARRPGGRRGDERRHGEGRRSEGPLDDLRDEDGRTVSTHIDDREMAKNLHAGDQIELTYTGARLVSVEPEKE